MVKGLMVLTQRARTYRNLERTRLIIVSMKHLLIFSKPGLIQFSYFISRSIPDELKKVNPDEQELHSSRSGIKAYDKCIKLLTKELNTGKTGYKEPKDYKKLSDWYVNGLIDFMGITMVDIPDELDNLDDLDHVVKSAIEAFKQVKKLLSDEVKELTHVQ